MVLVGITRTLAPIPVGPLVAGVAVAGVAVAGVAVHPRLLKRLTLTC